MEARAHGQIREKLQETKESQSAAALRSDIFRSPAEDPSSKFMRAAISSRMIGIGRGCRKSVGTDEIDLIYSVLAFPSVAARALFSRFPPVAARALLSRFPARGRAALFSRA